MRDEIAAVRALLTCPNRQICEQGAQVGLSFATVAPSRQRTYGLRASPLAVAHPVRARPMVKPDKLPNYRQAPRMRWDVVALAVTAVLILLVLLGRP